MGVYPVRGADEPTTLRCSRERRDLTSFGEAVRVRYGAHGHFTDGASPPTAEELMEGWHGVVTLWRGDELVGGCAIALDTLAWPLQALRVFEPDPRLPERPRFEVGRLITRETTSSSSRDLMVIFAGCGRWLREFDRERQDREVVCALRAQLLDVIRDRLRIPLERVSAPPPTSEALAGPIVPLLRACVLAQAPWDGVMRAVDAYCARAELAVSLLPE